MIARGGRYDDLVYRCGARGEHAAGVGFGFAIDPIRELLGETPRHAQRDAIVLVAFSPESSLESALRHQSQWHQKGCRAFVELAPVANRQAAEEMATVRSAGLDRFLKSLQSLIRHAPHHCHGCVRRSG